ncbi:MAG TPA: lipopolysaccharide heptosyltransferase II [Tepidisphaeraceae bacterium]|nr:lipopolysaccharide heptosyltransferase II [Tepidisphaeraceae bacterium]
MTTVPLTSAPRRILIFKPSAIGDVVHTLPILNLLKRRWPEAKISWLLTPICAPLVEGHPQVEEVIQFNRKRYGHAWRSPTASTAFFKFIKGLRDRQFDWVLDFQGLFRSGLMSWGTGAPVRVGFDDAREGAPMFYTHAVSSGGWWNQHAIGRYLHMAAAVGCEMGPVEFRFVCDDADRAAAAAMIPGKNGYAALVPGTHWDTKKWPIEKFARLVKPLKDRFGLECITLGGPADATMAANIQGATNLCGRTTLRQTIALIERAALIVANDSGPMHIACALNRPLVALFGPTSPLLTGPYGRPDTVLRLDLPCSPCYSRTCSHQSCLQWLEIEPVLRLAEQQMSGIPKGEYGMKKSAGTAP